MKKILGAGLAVLSLTIIVSGHLYYDHKLTTIAEETQNQNILTAEYTSDDSDDSDASDEEEESNEEIDEENNAEFEESDQDSLPDLDPLLPAFAEAISDVDETGEVLNIAIYASDVMLGIEGDGQSWPEMLDETFSDLLSDISYEIAVYSAGDLNTVELIQSEDYQQVLEDDRHIIVLESMLWNDNGQVSQDQSVEYIDQMKTAYEQAGSEVITILSPPAYQTVNYPIQIDYFSEYAESNEWLMADHWTYWPELMDDSLLNYVDAESRYLTEAGHGVVTESLLDVLGLASAE